MASDKKDCTSMEEVQVLKIWHKVRVRKERDEKNGKLKKKIWYLGILI